MTIGGQMTLSESQKPNRRGPTREQEVRKQGEVTNAWKGLPSRAAEK